MNLKFTCQSRKFTLFVSLNLQQLAEIASRTDKADDIFEYNRERGACVLVKLNGNNSTGLSVNLSSPREPVGSEISGVNSTSKAGKAVSRGDRNIACLRSSKGELLAVIDTLSDLRSPQALTAQSINDMDDHNGAVTKGGKKNNKAIYVHNLSKKVSKSVSSITGSHGSSSSIITKGKGKGKLSDIKNNAFSAKNKNTMNVVGSILSPRSKIGKNNADQVDELVEEVSSDPDDYNRNMSEDEDGDF